ncbi:MAG: WbqC family protein [Bacteroidaceae bacterium]
MSSILLPCCYLAPASHYSALLHAGDALIEVCDHYRRQTLRNRCMIDCPQGPLPLSIPVVKPQERAQTKDIRISEHGNWRHQHWQALASSYGQSPFFEYYADDLAPFYEKKWEFLADFNQELMLLMCNLLDIPACIRCTEAFHGDPFSRQFPVLKKPYWQVFGHRNGFRQGLSIVDLLFNMGPEGLMLL